MRRSLSLFLMLAAAVPAVRAFNQDPLSRDVPWDRFAEPQKGRASLSVEPPYFSPNGDKRQDEAFFSLRAEDMPRVDKWSLFIADGRGRTLRRFTGRGAPPALVEWNGTDEKGRALKEGAYFARAVVWGPGTKVPAPAVQVVVDVTPPALAVSASTASFSPGAQGSAGEVSFDIKAQDPRGAASWSLHVLSPAQPPAVVYAASGAFRGGDASAAWRGQTRSGRTAPGGAYSARAAARDFAGNVAVQTLAVEVRAAGGEELKNLLAALDTRPAPGGHRVVLRANRLFARGGAKLAPQSEELRLLVLDLVKALPGHRVELNGYVSSGKSAAERTRLASARAWAFYSYLVKSGVDAARLDVNGRAAAARSPDRLELLFKKAAAE